jgi:HK97 family phage prohead protease
MSEHKSFAITEFKSSDEPGSFEALVAVFGNVDAGGDRIQPGAFKRSLGEWSEKGRAGRNVPVLWSHDIESVPIGVLTKAHESAEGLHVTAKLFIDDNPQSKAVHAAMKAGALTEFSFGYGARDYSHVHEGGRKVRVLKDLDLGEVSPVFRGMNPSTQLLGVKSDEIPDEIEQIAGQIVELEAKKADLEAAREVVKDIAERNTLPKDPPPAEGTEHDDNPEPNSPDGDEEAKARIRALLVQHPIHQETDTP